MDASVDSVVGGGFHAELRAFSAAIQSELEKRELGFPTVLDLSLRIRQAANDPDSSVDQLAALIRVEPVLSSRVIRIANSVIYNRAGRRITSVAESIPRVGIAAIRVLALVVAMDQLAQEHRSRPMRELARGTWAHSLDVAGWAYALARRLRIGSADTALLAALMIDIGGLFLIARVGQYPAVAADVSAFAEIAELWRGPLTRAILERMDLPTDVVDAVEFDAGCDVHWPPSTLAGVLRVAALAAQSARPLDRRDDARRAQREATRTRVGAHAFDELLAACAPARDDVLAVLRE